MNKKVKDDLIWEKLVDNITVEDRIWFSGRTSSYQTILTVFENNHSGRMEYVEILK